MTPSCRTNRAFSLIELLVVISIITLLVALLLPALQRSRDAAQIAIEVSNARQFAMGIVSYTTDFGGWYPDGRRVYSSSVDDHSWYRLATWKKLREYLHSDAVMVCESWKTVKRYGNWYRSFGVGIGTPGSDWPTAPSNHNNDCYLGWNVWVGRSDHLRYPNPGLTTYSSPMRLTETNAGPFMFTCFNWSWSGGHQVPHARQMTFSQGATQWTDVTQLSGLTVARTDASAAHHPGSKLIRYRTHNNAVFYPGLPPR